MGRVRSDRRAVLGYRVGAAVASRTPYGLGHPLARAAGRIATPALGAKRRLLARHLARACGRSPSDPVPARAVRAAVASYASYWFDVFRLPSVPMTEVLARFEIVGGDRIDQSIAGGRGMVLALPHLGSWEIGARWLSQHTGYPTSAVVEMLEPPAGVDWFREQREAMGIDVIPLDDRAFGRVVADLAAGRVVCLVADRDLSGSGVEVELFGERTTLPAGPALAALRTGVPVCPAAVYTRARGRYLGVVRPPLDTTRRAGLRADVARITQDLARELEVLVQVAPTQWHLLQPNWPSDRDPDVAVAEVAA